MIKQYQKVRVLTDDFSGEGVHAGDVGYVIECYPGGRYEVEVSGAGGITVAQFVAEEKDIEVADSVS
ncbi:DUF4926 domain-containing protein [Amycolatopsis jejuensis]|uniref:DUF4926 domain-containing protein n=1 Tax=Amycolatopsis jejuensis TaxID=330084 RepID=UPI0009FBAAA9|nr:DUF4926 domain-containing protein [Amycolatopsis jejuensis]